MINSARQILLGLLLGLAAGVCFADTDEDASASSVTIVSADALHAVNPSQKGNSLAFDDQGRILAIGELQQLNEQYAQAEHIDASGGIIIPGLIDAHGHVAGLGFSLSQVDLVDTESVDDIIERLKKADESLPEGAWIQGRGWDQNDWPVAEFPSAADLDEQFPDRPVWVRRIDGHAAWANTAAMSAVDRDLSGDWQIDGGDIRRDSDGKATGIFIDAAMSLVDRIAPQPSPAEVAHALGLAFDHLSERGITGVHEAGTSLALFNFYRTASRAGKLPVRLYTMADGPREMLDWLCENGIYDDDRLTARSLKLYGDGALGSRGAALLEDYSDDPGNRGLLVQSLEEITNAAEKAAGCGLQVNIHAIGDRASRNVLDVYQSLNEKFPDNPGRHRMEHAQILDLADIPRFAKLNVIASMQPTHATSDMPWAPDRLGDDRIAGAYAWQRLLKSGARLALGSDFPVERADPMLGLYAAVTRKALKDGPPAGWQPDQVLSRSQALRGFTADAAYAGFAEDEVGSLEPGKFADFVILDADIMTMPAEDILNTKVLATFVGGEPVYVRPGYRATNLVQ